MSFLRVDSFVSIHSCQFLHVHSFIPIHSCQFMRFNFLNFNPFMSIHSFQSIHANSFISILSFQFVHGNSFVSIHAFLFLHFQVIHVNSFMSIHSFHAFHFISCHFNSLFSNSPWIPIYAVFFFDTSGHYLVPTYVGFIRTLCWKPCKPASIMSILPSMNHLSCRFIMELYQETNHWTTIPVLSHIISHYGGSSFPTGSSSFSHVHYANQWLCLYQRNVGGTCCALRGQWFGGAMPNTTPARQSGSSTEMWTLLGSLY